LSGRRVFPYSHTKCHVPIIQPEEDKIKNMHQKIVKGRGVSFSIKILRDLIFSFAHRGILSIAVSSDIEAMVSNY
jgi:hypothetical protein